MRRTAGDLRKELAQLPADKQWTVDPNLKDEDLLPVPFTGETLKGLSLAKDLPALDFVKILSTDSSPGPYQAPRQHALINSLKGTATAPKPEVTRLPRSVDWCNRDGQNWICSIQDQDSASSCWAFAATALVESMVRIEHGYWSKRSEGDIRDGTASTWTLADTVPYTPDLIMHQGSSEQEALHWAQNYGLADLRCVPWVPAAVTWSPTSDRDGRSTRLPAATGIGPIEDQKQWLDNFGPLAAVMAVYDDFQSWKGPAPYTPGPNAIKDAAINGTPWHAILIVGYNDIGGYWKLKNSWGASLGINGYYYVAYGASGIDQHGKLGLTGVSPDPWVRRWLHNGCMIQSSNGAAHKNFELLQGGSSLRHLWREGGENGDFSWHAAETIAIPSPCNGMPTLTSTTYDRNFEAVYWESGTNLLRDWVFDQSTQKWTDAGTFGSGIAGYPGFIQSNIEAPGNLEVVVLQNDGCLHHYIRGNEEPIGYNWGTAESFASNILMSGPSLIQSNAPYKTTNGNYYLVAVLKTGQMQMWWKDNDNAPCSWHEGETFGSGIGATPPCMIQENSCTATSNENSIGNFSLCVQVGGQIQHWTRSNTTLEQAGTKPSVGTALPNMWTHDQTFGSHIKHVWSLLWDSITFDLVVIAEGTDGSLQIFQRSNNSTWSSALNISV